MSNTPIPRDLGKRIRDLRKAAKLDQGELADDIGVSEQFIKNLENEEVSTTNLSLVHLAALARVLKVPMYVLLGECDAVGEALPASSITWARKRGVAPDRLRAVLNYAARSPHESAGGNVSALGDSELDALLERLCAYESELGS